MLSIYSHSRWIAPATMACYQINCLNDRISGVGFNDNSHPNDMNAQLDLFPEQLYFPKEKQNRLRISNGQYCTPEQLEKNRIIRAAMAEETAKRHNTAIWRTLRRQSERIIRLENLLKLHNIKF